MNDALHVSVSPLTGSAFAGRMGVVMHPDARALKQRYEESAWLFEIPEDVVPFGEGRVAMLAEVNERRAANGLPPLANDEDGNPELTEQRRRRNEEYWEQNAKDWAQYEASLPARIRTA